MRPRERVRHGHTGTTQVRSRVVLPGPLWGAPMEFLDWREVVKRKGHVYQLLGQLMSPVTVSVFLLGSDQSVAAKTVEVSPHLLR